MSFSPAGWSINRLGPFTPSGIQASRVSARDGKDYTAKAINPAETNANVQRGRAWQGPCHEWNRLCKIIFPGDMAHSHEGAISFIMSAMVHQPKPRAATCQAVTTGDNNKKKSNSKVRAPPHFQLLSRGGARGHCSPSVSPRGFQLSSFLSYSAFLSLKLLCPPLS